MGLDTHRVSNKVSKITSRHLVPLDRAFPAHAKVRFHALPAGHRTEKFTALGSLRLQAKAWTDCPTDWRAPFLPASTGAWATYPKLEDLFTYNGSGVMPGRTWIIAPDSESLERRWQRLINAPASEKEVLFHPHLRRKGPGDKHSKRVVHNGLPGYEARPTPVSDEHGACAPPVLYGFRSFDRQWIIPDNRVVNQPNPELWRVRSNRQIFMTAPSDRSPTNGPALTMTAVIPDLHHYNGRGGRVFPLWSDADASSPNLPPKLLPFLAQRLDKAVSAEDVIAYVAAVAAHPAFTARFHDDLATPGLRLPITADADVFFEATALGRAVIWLHTFGERMADPEQGRPAQPPRLAAKKRPSIPRDGAISRISDAMPNSIDYDEHTQRLLIGTGYVENVPPAVWCYEVSGKRVLLHWFSYRKRDRTRPIIGALLRGSKTDPQRPLPTDPLTTDSVRRRPTTLSHLIEDVTCEDGLRLLPRPTARSKALPDDQLVPEEGVLHTGLLMVARVLLPLSPSSLLHLSDRAVARGRSWSPSKHGGCPGRWNDDRRATRTRSLVDATRVVGRVRREAGDVAFDLVDQIEGRRRVVNMPAGQGVSDDHARSVDAQMKLLPAAYTASAMFHGRPFTFTHSREPGTVDDEMYACARGEAAKCKVEVLTTP